jgi:HEAT repeat protein
MAVLVPRLEHPDWSIRRKAAQALGEVAKGVGDARAIRLLASLSRDPDEEVRIAVVSALSGAAPLKKCKELKDAVQMAATFAKDANPRIRFTALATLEELASVERSRSRIAVHAVSGCLKDDVEDVRLKAEQVMRTIAPGRRTAIDDIVKLLQEPDEGARQTAVKAFAGVAPERRSRAIKRIVPLLRHADAGVREAAGAAMQGMSPEESNAIAAAASAVARFRRRFLKHRGHALYDEEEDEEEEEDTSQAVSVALPEGSAAAAVDATRAQMAETLIAGDMVQAIAHHDDLEDLVHEAAIKEDTDTESELSESDTDATEEEEAGEDEYEDRDD